MKKYWVVLSCAAALGLLRPSRASALQTALSPEDVQEYQAVTSTTPWSAFPDQAYRLFIDIYNNVDFYDSEPGGVTLFQDGTTLADTIRPMATVLWNDGFRFQLGILAEQTFGNSPEISKIVPWIQALWKPTDHLTSIFGDLSVPHEFLPAIHYAPDYFRLQNHETGLQLLNRYTHWRDDLFFNYYQVETPTGHEEFEFGFTHYNEWKFINLMYQSDWLHEGGTGYPHSTNTINDVAQAAGVGLKQELPGSFIIGAHADYLDSHYRVDSDEPGVSYAINGDGRYADAYVRWSRLKVTYGYWRGHSYQHGTGDQYFLVDNMNQGILHWDVIASQEFTLFGEIVGYFVGNNNLGISHFVKPTFWIQGAWHFTIPARGWDIGKIPTGKPDRWDLDY